MMIKIVKQKFLITKAKRLDNGNFSTINATFKSEEVKVETSLTSNDSKVDIELNLSGKLRNYRVGYY